MAVPSKVSVPFLSVLAILTLPLAPAALVPGEAMANLGAVVGLACDPSYT
jgi:hypothetical protein